jgi:hypothetical protein
MLTALALILLTSSFDARNQERVLTELTAMDAHIQLNDPFIRPVPPFDHSYPKWLESLLGTHFLYPADRWC